jgi:hypothetical protein
MKTILVLFLVTVTAFLIACDKDKFETKPRIEVADYNSQIIPNNGTLVIRLNYFDKEGDLGTGQLYIYRDRLNSRPGNQDRADTFRYQLPEFTNRDKGEIRIEFSAAELTESSIENDTLRFKIAVADLANNHSDTITTDNLVILE